MSSAEDDSEGLHKKRKLNLLDFIKNDGGADEVEEVTKKFEPMSFQRPKTGLGAPEVPEEDSDYDGVDNNYNAQKHGYLNDIRPSEAGLNHMRFTPAAPLTFRKESTSKVEEDLPKEQSKEENKIKLSYSEIEALNNSNNAKRGVAFKGKKYGIGAALLKKMGYIEGQGLGKHGQGITEPIEQDVRRFGVGIGGVAKSSSKKKKGKVNVDISDEEDSSDEEYYKDVPKKSLYQIIAELEEKDIVVPVEIKRISDAHSQEFHKPFIILRKEGNKDLEELINKLDHMNNELEDSLAALKLSEFEEKELFDRDSEIKSMLIAYEQLAEKLNTLFETVQSAELNIFEKSKKLRSEISSLRELDVFSLPDVDIQKTVIVAIKPVIMELFSGWDPLDFSDETVLRELLGWKEVMPTSSYEMYDDLSYFQSLVYSLWYPKMVNALSGWTVDQPNIAITLLLDWNDVLDKSVIDYLVNNIVKPKIIQAIEDWNPLIRSENPPTMWLFEYIPYLENNVDEIKQELIAKFSPLLENWLPSNVIDGLSSFKEIVGFEAFDSLIQRKLLPKLTKVLINSNINFTDPSNDSLTILLSWERFLQATAFEVLLKFTFFNSWKRSLYDAFYAKNASFDQIASSFEKWVELFSKLPKHSKVIQTEIYEGLDMINEYLDTAKLTPIHTKGLTATKIIDLTSQFNRKPKTAEETVQGIPTHRLQVSFKEVVESYCAGNNLFITPIKHDISSGHSLFKISKNINGKHGLVAYIEEDVLWIKGPNMNFEPISLDSLETRL